MPNPMMLVPKRCDINNPFKGSTEVDDVKIRLFE